MSESVVLPIRINKLEVFQISDGTLLIQFILIEKDSRSNWNGNDYQITKAINNLNQSINQANFVVDMSGYTGKEQPTIFCILNFF